MRAFFLRFLGSGNGMIEFKNISKTFETDYGPVRAVQNVNLKKLMTAKFSELSVFQAPGRVPWSEC